MNFAPNIRKRKRKQNDAVEASKENNQTNEGEIVTSVSETVQSDQALGQLGGNEETGTETSNNTDPRNTVKESGSTHINSITSDYEDPTQFNSMQPGNETETIAEQNGNREDTEIQAPSIATESTSNITILTSNTTVPNNSQVDTLISPSERQTLTAVQKRLSKMNKRKQRRLVAEKKDPKHRTIGDFISVNAEGIPMKSTFEKRKTKVKAPNPEDDINIEQEENQTNQINQQTETLAPSDQGTSIQVTVIDGEIVPNVVSMEVGPIESGENDDNLLIAEYGHQSSYSKRSPSTKWSVQDTNRFYTYLRMHGSDFTSISRRFDNRNRKQIYNKFKKEEKINPQKVDWALKNPLDIDTDEYIQLLAPK